MIASVTMNFYALTRPVDLNSGSVRGSSRSPLASFLFRCSSSLCELSPFFFTQISGPESGEEKPAYFCDSDPSSQNWPTLFAGLRTKEVGVGGEENGGRVLGRGVFQPGAAAKRTRVPISLSVCQDAVEGGQGELGRGWTYNVYSEQFIH